MRSRDCRGKRVVRGVISFAGIEGLAGLPRDSPAPMVPGAGRGRAGAGAGTGQGRAGLPGRVRYRAGPGLVRGRAGPGLVRGRAGHSAE